MSPRDPVYECEARPHGHGRLSSVIVWRDGCQTVAATGDWELSVALMQAALPW